MPNTAIKPYPYQNEDIQELIERPKLILGSVMRSGKMYEVAELVRRLDLYNILIICPKPLVAEWQYKIEDWLGEEWLSRFDIFNYEKLRKGDLMYLIQKAGYELMVFDEAHKLKNRQAQQTKGAYLITGFTPRLILATGTPIENHPGDAWSLLHMIDPILFASYWKFTERYCVIEQLPKPPYPRIIVGPRSDTKQELRELLGKYMLRREKNELRDHEGRPVVMDRAPVRTIPVELTDSQLLKYQTMEEELFALLDNGETITAPAVLAQRTRLRQICLEPNLLSQTSKTSSPSAKTEIVKELVEDADGPIIIMTFFEQYARILTEELRNAGFKGAEYSGAPDIVPQRHRIVQEFQAGQHHFLVGTITSIGLGLTLTAAHQVIFTDLFYNPQVVNQCVSRLEGSGPPRQERPVEAVDLWARGTIEDHMHRVLNRKRKMFNEIVATEQEIWQETIDEMRANRRSRT